VRGDRPREEGRRKKKLIEHAEWRLGEQGEVAAAALKTEGALRRRAARLGIPYTPQYDAAALQPPALMPENVDAWELFLACQSQVITAGFGSVVGIDESTLKWKMDLLQIPPDAQLETLEKFQLVVEVFVRSCARASSANHND
jgi:hypothetical protein